MSSGQAKKLAKYKCTKCNLSASPLLVCPLLHKICGKCYDLFSHPTILCPICKLEFTSTEESTNEQRSFKKNTNCGVSNDSLIDELLRGIPETTDNSAFSVMKENQLAPFYENQNTDGKSYFPGYGVNGQRTEPKEEASNRQIRKLCFMALWNTATSVFGNRAKKSKGSASPSASQIFSNIIMNSLIRRLGTPVFLILEKQSKNPRTRNNSLYIGGGLLALLFILGYCTKSAKKVALNFSAT